MRITDRIMAARTEALKQGANPKKLRLLLGPNEREEFLRAVGDMACVVLEVENCRCWYMGMAVDFSQESMCAVVFE